MVAGLEGNRISGESQAMSCAFDQRDFIFVGIDEPSRGGAGGRAHLVHEDVMVSGGVERAYHGEVEKPLNGFDRRACCQRDTGSVEEDFIKQTRKMSTGVQH